MTVAETVLHKVESLPPDRQVEVLRFVESIERESALGGPLRDPAGLLAGKAPDFALEDFAAARREMWKGFPRELPND
ncbi:MAG TPA: hypothetical protein VGI81_17495 [Tepidisphaeraceae bacterium]